LLSGVPLKVAAYRDHGLVARATGETPLAT